MSKKNERVSSKPQLTPSRDWFTGLENRLDNYSNKILWIALVLAAVFSVLHFNVRVSEGGDDSTYIMAGHDYADNFFEYYYAFNAPFYPMFLSLPIKLFGIKLLFLKSLSIVFNLLFIYLFFKTFVKKIPSLVLVPILLFIAINSYFLYFASQTYNESFFLFWYVLLFFTLSKKVDDIDIKLKAQDVDYKQWAVIGLVLFIVTLTKNIAIIAVPAILLFFLFVKQFRKAAVFVGSFLVFKLSFEAIKSMIWGSVAQYKSQGDIVMLKDPYDKTKGYEDFAGYITRFFENINIYLSKRFFQILGFRAEDSVEVFAGLAFIVFVLFIIGLIYSVKKKNKNMLLVALVAGAICAGTFIILQTRWDQPRMILIHVPLILIVIFFGLYNMLSKLSMGKNIYIALVVLLLGSSLLKTLKVTGKNIPVLRKNLKGDMFYGFTPDWVNFLNVSKWCADNLPGNAYVASRKAPMSFIYSGGKRFFPVYKVLGRDTVTGTANPDSVLAIFKKNKVTHIILASIRMNPSKNTGNIINTMHNILQPVAKKYPERVKLIYQYPTVEMMQIEPCFLYEIKTD